MEDIPESDLIALVVSRENGFHLYISAHCTSLQEGRNHLDLSGLSPYQTFNEADLTQSYCINRVLLYHVISTDFNLLFLFSHSFKSSNFCLSFRC